MKHQLEYGIGIYKESNRGVRIKTRSMVKIKKTNAIRMLDRNKIEYIVYSQDVKVGGSSGLLAALKNNKDPLLVHKTLVARGSSKTYYVFVIPIMAELDLKKAAIVVNEKKMEMIPVKNLLKLTGYVKGGCSPIGMKKQFKTILDASATAFDQIIVSAGKLGMHIAISPQDLMNVVQAASYDIVKNMNE